MFKYIAKWLAGILRAELKTVQVDVYDLRRDMTSDIAVLREQLAAALSALHSASDERAFALTGNIDAVKAHVTAETDTHKGHLEAVAAGTLAHISGDYDDLKKYIHEEILRRYDTLVRDAAGAARLMDASKIAMAICDYCHLPSRRFSTSRIDGKIVCSDCVAKGQN